MMAISGSFSLDNNSVIYYYDGMLYHQFNDSIYELYTKEKMDNMRRIYGDELFRGELILTISPINGYSVYAPWPVLMQMMADLDLFPYGPESDLLHYTGKPIIIDPHIAISVCEHMMNYMFRNVDNEEKLIRLNDIFVSFVMRTCRDYMPIDFISHMIEPLQNIVIEKWDDDDFFHKFMIHQIYYLRLAVFIRRLIVYWNYREVGSINFLNLSKAIQKIRERYDHDVYLEFIDRTEKMTDYDVPDFWLYLRVMEPPIYPEDADPEGDISPIGPGIP